MVWKEEVYGPQPVSHQQLHIVQNKWARRVGLECWPSWPCPCLPSHDAKGSTLLLPNNFAPDKATVYPSAHVHCLRIRTLDLPGWKLQNYSGRSLKIFWIYIFFMRTIFTMWSHFQLELYAMHSSFLEFSRWAEKLNSARKVRKQQQGITQRCLATIIMDQAALHLGFWTPRQGGLKS